MSKKCKEGIKSLRVIIIMSKTKTAIVKNTPAHDWSSHGCDAFRYMAVAFKETVAPKPYKRQNYGGHGWMG